MELPVRNANINCFKTRYINVHLQMRAYTRRELQPYVNYTLSAHLNMVPFLERYFGIDYPLKKLCELTMSY